MITQDQRDVIHALSMPAFYGHDVATVERIDTHISVVFLAGPRVFKLKRAVKFDYVDFSSLERRRLACGAEVEANRRAAPALYRGVTAITREPDGRLQLGGHGQPVDYVVEMARFDQETLFDRLASRGALTRELMTELAAEIAAFHAGAAPRRDHGGLSGMSWVVDGNSAGLRTHVHTVFPADACDALDAATRTALARMGPLLDARRAGGHVRQCHGDLHLRNICLVDGTPTLFDAIEFNDELSCVDTAYDLAFLLMDLLHRRLRPWANLVLNEYTRLTGDRAALQLLPLFLACRATVRAKIGADAADVQAEAERATAMQQEARDYLALARACLEPHRASITAIGGLSGTGKSTVAAHVAPVVGALPGALVLRSDVVRKTLWGAASTLERLPAEAYSSEMTGRVYAALADQARDAVATGHAVIVDAVFLNPAEREHMTRVAAEAGVPFAGIWLEAPAQVLTARVDARAGDASDATSAIVARQLQQSPGHLTWTRVNASDAPERVVATVRRTLLDAGLDIEA